MTNSVPDTEREPRQLAQGFHWEDIQVGQRFRTWKRTVTEADLVGFIAVTGMLERIFIEATPLEGGISGRPVPAALTYSLIEGFILQSMIQGTGMAMLELTQKIHAPVRVNDTIHGIVEVTAIRPTSKGGRAIVDSTIQVFNQDEACVMTYTARRMLKGRTT